MLHHYDIISIDFPQHLGGFLLDFVLPGNKNIGLRFWTSVQMF